ncbi:MAG: mandelate racemase/muconate lactonizing enzyme family protein [Nitrospinota bacterium]|jgi:L-alanine-DL-glutamate epimerase-like enolase superfamily enzyme|nr:mandelate racemase/muconate lactonizing enzyme family protein [Nitrospinota bacterium]MDP7167102.1 mandelate racemase/muconate lactonizing enzyme family protein [Nitrospinota bacterium]MDP7370732.1 mandelate racemase/muconate lactonizing enzyme family protein [Nitrospinota bacterium]MDP7505709.1 mandelate racemase/muconate lactonizing enzyme family protein [Nitrospinota bacterium]MDP7661839.1 mandelate racemase/muconate lactonizing enzyme family protein [Nitrospinota bacterium]
MPKLKIRAVEAVPMPLPLDKPIGSALGTYTHVDFAVVTVHTEGGPSGTGFSMGLGGAATSAIVPYIENELAPLAIGQDALAPEAFWQRLWGPNKARMRGGLGVWALSALDIACWDIVGKAAGLPLHRLLGGFRDDVPVYASGGWHTLSDAELVAEAEDFASRGFSAYKFKIGTDRDEERTALLRQELGEDFTLFADANQKFNVREAIEVSCMLAEYGVAWFEEPVLADSIDDLAEVAEKSMVPVGAGENHYMRWGFRELCERRAVDYLQPDVCRCGGVTEFMKVAHLADAFNISLSSHLVHEVSISLVGATPRGYMVEFMELIPAGSLTREFVAKDGMMRVPDASGHGVEFTPEAIKKFSSS